MMSEAGRCCKRRLTASKGMRTLCGVDEYCEPPMDVVSGK